jgi:hypothetical protein
MLRFFSTTDSSVADIALIYQRNIYHRVEQGIFMQGDKGMLSLRQTSTDLYPEKAMVYVTSGGPG